MQATPISNPSQANASSPAVAAQLPFDPHPSSPFTAVFHAALSGAGSSAKFPPAGKAKDSSREPAGTSRTGNNPLGLSSHGMVVPASAPILSASSLSPAASPIQVAPVDLGRDLSSQPESLSDPLTAGAATGPDANAALLQGAAQSATAVTTPAASAQSAPGALIPDSNFISQASNLSPNPDEIANGFSGSPSHPQNVSTNNSNPPNSKAVDSARADLGFLNMQALNPAGAAAKASISITSQPETNPEAQSNPQPLANLSPTLPETLAHSAAKSAAMGASTFKLHENLQAQAANPSSPGPVAAVLDKAQSQGDSNTSSGDDSNASNAKVDHASNARTNDKGFVQSLDTAAMDPLSGHSATADSNAVAAAAPAPVQIANSSAQLTAPSSSDSQAAETLPAASQSAPVVSAAHIVDQPGQTEIRIEMQADSLGGVELRARIAGDQIGASIAVEHHDAQMALAADLPALHGALIEKNLRVESLSVSQGSFSSLNGGLGQDAGQRGFAQPPAKFAYLEQPETPEPFTGAPAEWAGPSNSGAGLSVVA